jgi:hypothetical protein
MVPRDQDANNDASSDKDNKDWKTNFQPFAGTSSLLFLRGKSLELMVVGTGAFVAIMSGVDGACPRIKRLRHVAILAL